MIYSKDLGVFCSESDSCVKSDSFRNRTSGVTAWKLVIVDL